MRLLFAKNKAILRPLPKRSVNHFRDWLPENSLPDRSGGRIGYRMPLHLERIAWMPSPPLAPDDGPIDMDHLQRMTLGDAGLEREVLTMFSAQAASLIGSLAASLADAGTLAHTLKNAGWQTGAFVGAFVLDGKWGLNQGFDTYYDKFDLSKYRRISLKVEGRARSVRVRAGYRGTEPPVLLTIKRS